VKFNRERQTRVFLIKAANAPTPPRSPADIPSTSSMIKHDLEEISTPTALTDCEAFRPCKNSFERCTHPLARHPLIERLVHDICTVLRETSGTMGANEEKRLTSISFLLRASLAFISIGVKPASCAHRWALVVLPIPGGPEISMARYMFVPFFPGFLKLDFKLPDQSPNHCWSFSI